MKESDGKLTYETLRASVLNMRGPGASDAPRPPTARPLREKCTMNAKHLLDRRKMEKVAEAKDKEIKLLHKELDDLRKELLERKNVELDASDAAEQVSRRDEQLEFLMNVHDAAKDADWVSPAGAPRNAAAALTGGYDDPVAFLEALGVDTATAIAVLEANGGDASRAAESLFGGQP